MAEQEQDMQAIMGLIINGGNAKSSAFEAINAAKEGDFKRADEKLKESDEVAYLRFLSVYKSFGSAKKFQKEAEKLNK